MVHTATASGYRRDRGLSARPAPASDRDAAQPGCRRRPALFAVVPILEGLLYSLKGDVVAEVGGREQVKLKMRAPAAAG